MPVHAVVSGTTPTQRYGSTGQPLGLVGNFLPGGDFLPGNFGNAWGDCLLVLLNSETWKPVFVLLVLLRVSGPPVARSNHLVTAISTW